jgi:hypothetical protein
MARAAGYSGELPSDVRERLFLASAMKLQYEVLTTDLVNGQQVDADMMLRLSSSIATILPKPVPQKLIIEFVDNGEDQITSLAKQLDKVEQQVRELRSENALLKRGAPPSPDVVTLPPSEYANVVPTAAPRRAPKPEFSDAYEMLASANAGLGLPSCPAAPRSGAYLPPDQFDQFGRRVKQT